MGIFGIGREERSSNPVNGNEEIVKGVVTEVALSETKVEEGVGPIEQKEVEINEEERKLVNTFRKVEDPMNRRDFLRVAGIFAAGLAVAGCTPKQPFRDEELKSTVEAMSPLQTNSMEIGREFLLKDPIRLNPKDFSIGAEGYPTAIIERSQISKNDQGEPLFIRYGGQFNEVTYLHYTGQIPPVVGEILPFMYKLPQDMNDKEINIVPYAISIQSEIKKIDFNDSQNHYVIPIVTSGNNSGIVQRMENGPSKSFEVVPDGVSGNTRGFLSWAILTEIGNELVLEGITVGNSGIFIDQNSIPEEIQSLIREN